MKIVLRIEGMPDGRSTPYDGQYVQYFDFEYDDGRGFGLFTPLLRLAKKFDTMEAALEFYNRQPKCRPVRFDGRPNKPLTATNISFEPVPEDNP